MGSMLERFRLTRNRHRPAAPPDQPKHAVVGRPGRATGQGCHLSRKHFRLRVWRTSLQRARSDLLSESCRDDASDHPAACGRLMPASQMPAGQWCRSLAGAGPPGWRRVGGRARGRADQSNCRLGDIVDPIIRAGQPAAGGLGVAAARRCLMVAASAPLTVAAGVRARAPRGPSRRGRPRSRRSSAGSRAGWCRGRRRYARRRRAG